MPIYEAARGGTAVRRPDGQTTFVHEGAPLPDFVTGDQLAELLAAGRAVADSDPIPDLPSAPRIEVEDGVPILVWQS